MNVEIRKSSIHGNGLFSLTTISKNTKICDYIGEEMSLRQFREIYGSYKDNCLNTYRMKRINRIIVAKQAPYKTQNLVNYINESDAPNSILKKRALYALQDINENEEITIKYPKDYNREWKV